MSAGRELVVVTGISGFVGKWIALRLLEKGYAVRGTLRDLGKQPQVEKTLRDRLGETFGGRLSFTCADLLQKDDWPAALAGAGAVMHVAAHVVAEEPRDPESVVRPALEGTANVLAAAEAAGIRRIILTSSIATVGYGQGHTSGVRSYTESNWTDLDGMRWTWAYCVGKTRAERLAWSFAKERGLDLTTIHPGMILGPPLDADAGISVKLISGLLSGLPPAYPNLGFSLSDVRDVADMHVAALENRASVGERYLCTSSYMRFARIADMLRSAYPDAPVPSRSIPDWLMRMLAPWVRDIRQVINDVGNEKHFDGSKGRRLLGRDYRSDEKTILDCASSLFDLGLVPRR